MTISAPPRARNGKVETMDRYAGEIIEGIYASMEGAADVALVERVLDDVRRQARLEMRQAAADVCLYSMRGGGDATPEDSARVDCHDRIQRLPITGPTPSAQCVYPCTRGHELFCPIHRPQT